MVIELMEESKSHGALALRFAAEVWREERVLEQALDEMTRILGEGRVKRLQLVVDLRWVLDEAVRSYVLPQLATTKMTMETVCEQVMCSAGLVLDTESLLAEHAATFVLFGPSHHHPQPNTFADAYPSDAAEDAWWAEARDQVAAAVAVNARVRDAPSASDTISFDALMASSRTINADTATALHNTATELWLYTTSASTTEKALSSLPVTAIISSRPFAALQQLAALSRIAA
ncbi:uncharacterized protein AMSG_04075 [Thecamonas trahens ATCC 50062]|uniref:Uncharacterized protein n=1 Tax=Thecamonas trahens ATCC 50062 TaxID=461836 RepID=A0A0L0D6L9_THETB|nr:hypothetical protein AMSG_04075 [Thecamonas trahens ATCC 50062]KNC47845.1 hypothetical protein AMSG_04075 [Thecamonas trahens ATCC 50062]|eukprot:XP_013759323.1 hypothetical protein AMSG_04075 [Thecamonas trahens ATCC 50062]